MSLPAGQDRVAVRERDTEQANFVDLLHVHGLARDLDPLCRDAIWFLGVVGSDLVRTKQVLGQGGILRAVLAGLTELGLVADAVGPLRPLAGVVDAVKAIGVGLVTLGQEPNGGVLSGAPQLDMA